MATRTHFSATTREVSQALGFAIRTVQDWAAEGLVELRRDVATGQYRIHEDYLNTNSLRTKRLLRVR
jgi:DNA-binding transcriptional MerR regulator